MPPRASPEMGSRHRFLESTVTVAPHVVLRQGRTGFVRALARMAGGPDVYDDGVLRVACSGSPPVLVIAGEIDESNYSGLVGVLGRLTDGVGEVHVDLSGVAFCDLAGLRAIVRLAEPGPGGGRDGRRLVLHRVPRQMHKVLQIVGWDATPGLVLEPGGPKGGR